MNMQQRGATLVFPAVNQAAWEYLSAARQRGEVTLVASSVAGDAISAEWGEVHILPSIYAEDFSSRLLALVEKFAIRRVYCPVASVHDFMRRFIAEQHLDIEMIGQSPIRQQMEQHRQLMGKTARLLPFVELCADGAACPDRLEVAGVLKQASMIYGESNDEKLAAMMGVLARAVQGDVVEIGSLMGRSAFALLYLALRYQLGCVLTVDPWMPAEAIQHDSPEPFQALVNDWDFEVLSEGFFVNMVPFSMRRHAHLRMPSAEAFQVYGSGKEIRSQLGGSVPYARKIAVIHIDGNHDYAQVRRDCDLWLPLLSPGAWLILDDYVWAHGDGPQRVGDEILSVEAGRIRCAFVCGKALFVNLA